jgi:HK97 family phage portal protein
MNIMQKAAAVIVRAMGLQDIRLVRSIGASPSYSGEVVTQSTALGISATWACVNLLAGTIGSLPLMVYRTVNGERSVAKDHPLYRILHDRPNFDQTAVDFLEYIAAALELDGNAYAEMEFAGGGRLVSLTPIRPDLVQTRRLSNGDIEYSWTACGSMTIATQARVLHIRGFGGGPLGGVSTLAVCRQAFGSAIATERAAGSVFGNGARPSGVLSTKETLNSAQRNEMEELLQSKFVGAVNDGRPMLLDRDMQWAQLTINPIDAQMLESRRFSVEEICRVFGVPPHMIGQTDKATSWGTGLEQQTLGFQKFTLRRRLKRIEQALEQQLLSEVERQGGVTIEFNIEGLLRADSGARSTFYASALQNGWMTINEVRGLENLPPVEGGDVPRMQMQNMPITEAANPVGAPAETVQ